MAALCNRAGHIYFHAVVSSSIGKKLVKQQYLLHMTSQYGELRPTIG